MISITMTQQRTFAEEAQAFELLPSPRHIEILKGTFSPTPGSGILVPERSQKDVQRSVDMLRKLLKSRGLPSELSKERAPGTCSVSLAITPELVPQPDGYRISISPDQLTLSAHDAAGLYYAVHTLSQILGQVPEKQALPCMNITDWPDFAHRGIMLDVTRDKVPTMETLYGMVDKFSSWKINQLQLYTEHAFAYKNHETVWKDASPMTPEQIKKLDAYCRERFIELVPNQNSFGHMNRWLKHKRYSHLAETPGGSDLSPVMPGSIELLREMYDDLLPNFSSSQFNVGCDETGSLGEGKSKAAVEKRGVGKVYFEFLMKIYTLCKERGVTMQFWGDIILHHPELIPELPKNIIAMVWGYRPDHPYKKQCSEFKKSGVPFYVCPGTSSWGCLSGRTQRAMTNIRNAAENGKKFGAIGFLLTDWGDNGHWQTYPCSSPAFVYGAGLSWSVDANKKADLPSLLDRYVYMDDAKVMGKLVCDIGNTYAAAEGYFDGNTCYLSRVLLHPKTPMTNNYFKWLTPDKIEPIRSHAVNAMQPLHKARPRCHDASLVTPEIRHSADLVLLACDLLDARLAVKDGDVQNIPAAQRKQMAERLKKLIKEHESIWLKRNRIGGLSDSSAKMGELLKMLESK